MFGKTAIILAVCVIGLIADVQGDSDKGTRASAYQMKDILHGRVEVILTRHELAKEMQECVEGKPRIQQSRYKQMVYDFLNTNTDVCDPEHPDAKKYNVDIDRESCYQELVNLMKELGECLDRVLPSDELPQEGSRRK